MVCLAVMMAMTSARAQMVKALCNCPQHTMAGIVKGSRANACFNFPNHRQIIVCGYHDTSNHATLYSEFILTICGNDSVIDFWDATQICRLTQVKDTLFVIETRYLPAGHGGAYERVNWRIEKIWFAKDRLMRKAGINRVYRKYNQAQINAALTGFESAQEEGNSMDLANRLFMAAVSGSTRAREYLKLMTTQAGASDGAFLEEYKELDAMLDLWNQK